MPKKTCIQITVSRMLQQQKQHKCFRGGLSSPCSKALTGRRGGWKCCCRSAMVWVSAGVRGSWVN